MKENKISITVDWNLEYDEQSLNSRIEDTIVREATKMYLENLDKSFAKKLEKLLNDQAFKIVKNINRIELDKCNTNGLKESISLEDFIINKATESLTIKRDKYGQIDGYNSEKDKRTIVEWVVNDIISSNKSKFQESLRTEIEKIEKEFQNNLEKMVTKTLTPIYVKLTEKLNS